MTTESTKDNAQAENTTPSEQAPDNSGAQLDTPDGGAISGDTSASSTDTGAEQPVGQSSGEAAATPASDTAQTSSDQPASSDTEVKDEVVQEAPQPKDAEVIEQAGAAESIDKVVEAAKVLIDQEVDPEDAALGIGAFSAELKARIKELFAIGSPISRVTMMEILDYVNELAPGNQVEETRGKQMQLKLYASLQNIINNGATDFEVFFDLFVSIVHELKEHHVFSDRYFDRFTTAFALSDVERSAYVKLISAIKSLNIADGKQTIVIPEEATAFLSEEGKGRIKKHFTV